MDAQNVSENFQNIAFRKTKLCFTFITRQAFKLSIKLEIEKSIRQWFRSLKTYGESCCCQNLYIFSILILQSFIYVDFKFLSALKESPVTL